MSISSEILAEVQQVFRTKWETRDGQQVPEAEDLKLGNDSVSLTGTVLYADMADSTDLVTRFKNWFAAEMYKSYLVAACRLIRENGGVITAFDGDRVMAVYIGDNKNSAAARTALQIKYVVSNILNKAIKEAYPDTAFVLDQSVGIDTGPLFVARTGIRGANDLVWVGRAANYAAKLCSLREGTYSSFITAEVYGLLNEKSKFGGNPKQDMWEKTIWKDTGTTVYRSSWWWEP